MILSETNEKKWRKICEKAHLNDDTKFKPKKFKRPQKRSTKKNRICVNTSYSTHILACRNCLTYIHSNPQTHTHIHTYTHMHVRIGHGTGHGTDHGTGHGAGHGLEFAHENAGSDWIVWCRDAMERERAAHAFNGQLESRQYRYRVTPEMVRWNQHDRASEGARVKCVKVCVD